DDVTRILAAGREHAAEEMNDRHPFRLHALGRMIDVEQKILVSALAEDDVRFHAQASGVLGLGPQGRKTRQCRSRSEGTCCFYKTTSADLLHLPSSSCTTFSRAT